MTLTPALRIETWALASLIPYAGNPRKNDHAVDRMASSIQEFGFRIPILARSSGEVIDGHLRLKAAEKLGITEVPVILCDDWTEAQVKAFRLLVNRSVAWAEWDNELLALEMLDLRNLDYDLDLTGFETPEIDELLVAIDGGPTRTTRRRFRGIPPQDWAICGCAGTIAFSALMPLAPKLFPGYSMDANLACS